jgi:hypothetical protein
MLLLKSNNGLNFFVAILSRKEQALNIIGFRPV